MFRICVDTGGTFTEAVVLDEQGALQGVQDVNHAE